MKSISPYLIFQGKSEEAMNFYHQCFGGKMEIRRFEDTEMPVEEDYRNKVMHGELKISDSLLLMFSDGAPHKQVTNGNNIQINLEFEDPNQTEVLFNKLSEGGEVTMQLQITFWNAKFGMLKDKYGIIWMFNCPVQED